MIDTTDTYEPKNGAFIIKGEPNDKKITASSLIAAFDLDYTLIKPKSGNKFPKDYTDWVLLDLVKKKLTELYESNYRIVIFTNQGSNSFDVKDFAKKIRAIAECINVPLTVFGCSEHGYCRKPSVGLFWLLTRNNNSIDIDIKKSFYVGDAAGRHGDFADSDLKFALNLGLKFYTSIKMDDISLPRPVHPLELSPYFDKYLSEENVVESESQEMIILVGPPACGKSTFCKNFPNYIITCQDQLKTKLKVLSTVKQALKDGSSVIVDRKNEYEVDRQEFIQIAKDFDVNVRIIWFDIPRDLCEHLCVYREIMTGKHIPRIVFNKFYSKEKGLQEPISNEEIKVIKIQFKKDLSIVKNLTVFCSYLV
jgi:bifunctional polynucleotide phosphatase/kinase